MKKYLMMAAVAITLGLSGNVLAAPSFTVSGTGATMQGGFTSQTDVNGGAGHFWAGSSSDGTNMTVGNYLTKSGGFSSTGLNPPIGYTNLRSFGTLSAGKVQAVSDTTFGVTGASTGGFNIKIEVAGLAAENELWYMQPSSGGVLKRIFKGTDSAGATGSVSINGEFALFLIRSTGSTADQNYLDSKATSGMTLAQLNANTNSSNTTWAGSNSGARGYASEQHFAAFQDASDLSKVYVGVEDIVPLSSSDNDYNDLIIVMKLEEVPAPPALVLVALGVPALGLARRFTRKAPAAVVA